MTSVPPSIPSAVVSSVKKVLSSGISAPLEPGCDRARRDPQPSVPVPPRVLAATATSFEGLLGATFSDAGALFTTFLGVVFLLVALTTDVTCTGASVVRLVLAATLVDRYPSMRACARS